MVLYVIEDCIPPLGMKLSSSFLFLKSVCDLFWLSSVIISKIYTVIGIFAALKVALLNLITISSSWAHREIVIDVMDSEAYLLIWFLIPSRDFRYIFDLFCIQLGQDFLGSLVLVPHFGQLFGSLFATGMTRLGPCKFSCSVAWILQIASSSFSLS